MIGRIPFEEQKTPLRGVMDVITGAYPGFIFGAPLGRILPVFHFHDAGRDYLEPYFAYLAENGYRTVTSSTLEAVARGTAPPDPGTVALCFDDAWASLWTAVLPLLESYKFTAIAYVAPGRIEDAPACRAVTDARGAARSGPAFVTWPEVAALHASGRVDVQAHTQSHAMIFCAPELSGFVTPDTAMPLLSWPRCDNGPEAAFLSADMLGHPLLPQRSRMSDAYRYRVDGDAAARCCRHVTENGGARFFGRPEWERELRAVAGSPVLPGRFETDAERDAAIAQELVQCREILSDRLSKPISQICMPWAVCGRRAETLAREAGYGSVVADQRFGKRYVYPGANPFRLMRLKHQYILLLPGRGRRRLFRLRKGMRND